MDRVMSDAKSLLTWAVEFVEREADYLHQYSREADARRWLAEAREYLEKSGTTQG